MDDTPSFSVYVHNQGTVLACLVYLRFLAQQHTLTRRIPNMRPNTRKQILLPFQRRFPVFFKVRFMHLCYVQSSIMYVFVLSSIMCVLYNAVYRMYLEEYYTLCILYILHLSCNAVSCMALECSICILNTVLRT